MIPDVEATPGRTVIADDGTALHVREFGPPQGHLVILAHGWTMASQYWQSTIGALADTYRVVTYDQRGHGRSAAGPKRNDTVKQLGRDVSAVVADAVAASAGKAIVIGHSMGAMATVQWVDDYPEEAKRFAKAVILTNTAMHHISTKVRALPVIPLTIQTTVARRIVGSRQPVPQSPLLAPLLAPILRAVMTWLVLSSNAGTEAKNAALSMLIATKGGTRGRLGKSMIDLDIEEGLTRMPVSTSLIYARNDKLTPAWLARDIIDDLRHSGNLDEVHELTGVGHNTAMDKPEHFNRIIRAIVDKNYI